MKFTIAIPVRNGEKYLKQAIESTVSQNRIPDEILIVDYASTVVTSSIAKSYGNKITSRFFNKPTRLLDA
jgi:glycosyltransferase involved in cell wall biosynthesis